MYLYAGKVVWGGPPGICLLKNAGVENTLVWIHLCMFSWSVGDYICQYTPSAIAHSLIPDKADSDSVLEQMQSSRYTSVH